MDTRSKTVPTPRFYQDFEPSSEWVQDDKSEVLLIKLPGFKKEQMKVQIDSYRNLRTSGERPLDGNNNRWSHFRKDVHIPENLNLTGIRAKFENETLHVIIPKLIMTTASEPQQQPTQTQEPPATTKAKPEAAIEKEKDQPKVPRLNMTNPPEPQQQPTGAQEPPSTMKAEPEPVEATKENEQDEHKNEAVDYNAGEVDDQVGDKLFDKEKEAQAEERRGGSSIGSRWLGRKSWNGGGRMQEVRRQVLLNAAVTMFLLLALGIYLAYKAKRKIEDESY